MLHFITEKVNVERLTITTWNKQENILVASWIDINIQPDTQETIWFDVVSKWFKWFMSTNDKNLIQYNDRLISQLDWIIYKVKWTQFFKWYWKIPNSLELYLTLNETE